jgi:hypothetical protein
VVAIAALLSVLGPALDDNSAEHEVAKQELKKQRQQDRFERAAQEICGPNAAWKQTALDGEIQCFTHKGRKTITAKL